jgi:hypothetical protein
MKRVQLRFPGILDADGGLHPAIARYKFSLRLAHEQAASAFRSLRSPLRIQFTAFHRFHLSVFRGFWLGSHHSNSFGIGFRGLGLRFVYSQALS